MYKQLNVPTNEKVDFVSITSQINRFVRGSNIEEGVLIINIPHTTAAITVNEDADPSVKRDIINHLNKVIPFKDSYSHGEGNSAAHIKSSLIGCDQTIIIKDGKLLLGRWQGIFLCDFDGPRKRKVNLRVIAE
jgi:secondary thiamine-phosphate synthase enzyme